jgi:hypothetical protein
MNRREFIGVAGAAAALPISPADDGVVLFDARYVQSRDCATSWCERGFIALPTNQDVVRLWYENASIRRARQIAGATPHSDFEVLRRLLKDERRRLIVRHVESSGRLTSWHFA